MGIAEIGCAPGAGKTQWILDAIRSAHDADASFIAWFEHNKETDWRVTSSPRTARKVGNLISRLNVPS